MKHHVYEVDEYGVRNYRTRALALLSLGLLYTIIAVLAWLLLQFELASPHANITNYADAFWALQMSASTIGFGDFYPVTLGGRMVIAGMFYVGVGMVGFIGALIAERVLGFADTNVKNRELRKQNTEILEHNIQLEKKMDRLLAQFEQRS
ncbi:MAG TPA: two pore domain potassium channel family protein [Oceanospirillaceae bacterium]|nr:two pore domain potassium channel family protein [Oceanospirillaceae bacterium]